MSCSTTTQRTITAESKPITDFNHASAGKAPDVARNLTADRLRAARREPQNWLTYYGTYDGQRYSTLDQINADNFNTLEVAWRGAARHRLYLALTPYCERAFLRSDTPAASRVPRTTL